MKIKFKKLDHKAEVPTYAHSSDAGADLFATSINETELFIEYGTSLALEIPEGYAGFIFPRSSVSKTALMLNNSVAIIDCHYRGEIKLRFKRIKGYDSYFDYKRYNVGDKIGQLIVMPVPDLEFEEVQELSNTERGDGGFGSSGN